jgi:hypothetical protein
MCEENRVPEPPKQEAPRTVCSIGGGKLFGEIRAKLRLEASRCHRICETCEPRCERGQGPARHTGRAERASRRLSDKWVGGDVETPDPPATFSHQATPFIEFFSSPPDRDALLKRGQATPSPGTQHRRSQTAQFRERAGVRAVHPVQRCCTNAAASSICLPDLRARAAIPLTLLQQWGTMPLRTRLGTCTIVVVLPDR